MKRSKSVAVANNAGPIPRPKGRGLIEAEKAGREMANWGKIPRPKGRGLIEARDCGADREPVAQIPRPKGRGLIEALPASWADGAGCGFRGRKVAASLKLVLRRSGEDRHMDSAAERSRPH